MKVSFQPLGRAILFLAALGILVYEFVIGPHHGQRPDSTIVIAAIGLAAASISLKWDWR
jgi:branched-subunit amino acid ABC-type transport system permease component